jgi:superfamily I DNA/RNA helicase
MRLAGASLTAHLENNKETLDLDSLIPQATAMLRGECDIHGLKPDEMRERLLAGYRHILIDEYQDIDKAQYEMISAIAGRTLDSENDDAKLSISQWGMTIRAFTHSVVPMCVSSASSRRTMRLDCSTLLKTTGLQETSLMFQTN